MTTWYTSPRWSNGHLARDGERTYCGIPLNALVAFQPLHDGQTCWHCVRGAGRAGDIVELPGYPDGVAGDPRRQPPHRYPPLQDDRPPVEPIDLDALEAS